MTGPDLPRDGLYPPHAFHPPLFGADQCGLCGAPELAAVHVVGRLDTSPWHHARRGDPDTSHGAAASVNIGRQARWVLARYWWAPDGLTDHEAGERAGLGADARQRCSDLRHAGLIEPTGEKRPSPRGRPARVCRITEAGRVWLAAAREATP